MADTNYLDEERKKIWERLELLEKEMPLTKSLAEEAKALAVLKIPTQEAEAKQNLEDTKKSLEKANAKKDEADALFSEIQTMLELYKANKSALSSAVKKAAEIEKSVITLQEVETSIVTNQESIQTRQTQTEQLYVEAKTQIDNIKKFDEDASSFCAKIKSFFEKSQELKGDISDIHDEIMGYDTEDGKHEDGLKDELAESYKQLKNEYSQLKNNFLNFSGDIDEKLEFFLKEANDKKDAVISEIRSYLPDAVTAGLAGAFEEKKEKEITERDDASVKFSKLISVMVGIAGLPLLIYVAWFFQGKTLEQIILQIPNMTLAILPLYAPLIWLGIHFNHRINLSKKLIEEYAYKEAVCKSFSGLSEQITAIDDKEALQELQLKLIDLVMSVNSDNPGKYITNYDKCDNPLVELFSHPERLKKLEMEFPGIFKCLLEAQQKKLQKESEEE